MGEVETHAESFPFYCFFFGQRNRSQGHYLRIKSGQRCCVLRREDKV